jgi:hypothetical protein
MKANDGYADPSHIDEKIKDSMLPFKDVTPRVFEKVMKMLFNKTNIRNVICE